MICDKVEKEYTYMSKFKLCCDRCDTVYNLKIEDTKQIHDAVVECKCGNTIKTSQW